MERKTPLYDLQGKICNYLGCNLMNIDFDNTKAIKLKWLYLQQIPQL